VFLLKEEGMEGRVPEFSRSASLRTGQKQRVLFVILIVFGALMFAGVVKKREKEE